MGGACDVVEGGGDDDRLSPRLGHQQKQFGEPDVEADADTDLTEFRVKEGQFTAWCQRVRLPKMGAVGDGCIKEMDLAMACRLSALSVKDKAGVIELLPVQLGEGTAYHPDVVGTGGVRKGLPDRTAGGLGIGTEILMLIGTAEHLRQHRQVCPLLCGGGDLCHSIRHVLGLIQHGAHLDQSSFHVEPVLSKRR